MKRIQVLLLCIGLLAGACSCSSQESTPKVTLDDVVQAIQTVDPDFAFGEDEEDKPMYSIIGASDGWMGYLNGTTPVKVYQYDSFSDYENAKDIYAPMMDDWPVAGTFVLECNDPDVQVAFSAIEE